MNVSTVIALDDDPRAATRFYAFVFDTDADVTAGELTIGGLRFRFVRDSARELTPAVSFMVRFPEGHEDQLRELWSRLIGGDDCVPSGAALMPLTSYDFSPLFGWLADGNGVNWQLMVVPPHDTDTETPVSAESAISVVPYFMWTGDEPQAAAATAVYNSIFGVGNFMVLDSPGMHDFTFGDGVAMHLSTESDFIRARQMLGLEDTTSSADHPGSIPATNGNPQAKPQPDRFGVYWV